MAITSAICNSFKTEILTGTHNFTASSGNTFNLALYTSSASLGAKNKDGEMRAMYEPIHGSAPDIAGKGVANPIASILSFAMALRYSLDLDKEAEALEKAVQEALNDGLRTKDIMSDKMKEVSTSQMGDAIISKLQ